jgi:hypothetical protein
MLGFELDFWDYATFGAPMIVGAGFIALFWLMMSWPGRIAIARRHPEAEAVNMMGWLGFVTTGAGPSAARSSERPGRGLSRRPDPR